MTSSTAALSSSQNADGETRRVPFTSDRFSRARVDAMKRDDSEDSCYERRVDRDLRGNVIPQVSAVAVSLPSVL